MATDRSRRRTWTFSVAIVFTFLILYLTTGVASGLRSGVNIILTPFSWAVNTIAHPLGHMLAGTIDYSDVVAQNQKLRYQLGKADERANAEEEAETLALLADPTHMQMSEQELVRALQSDRDGGQEERY